MQTDLPNSFRFTGTKSDALAVREIFKQRYIPTITAVTFDGLSVEPPRPVEAFPDELVWDMTTHKKVIRKYPPFKEFQKFLVAEAASGNISRQEVVSMIPPHFLDVKPGMVVLDMCAAPGSKSAQLAEMIHGDEEERVIKAANNESPNIDGEGDYSDDGRSTGLLVANDTDYKRAGMLVHQLKRLDFPNLIVTQHDASIYPSIELPNAEGGRPQYLKFDRILADVPCSGDGTARKNINVWSKWTPKDGLGLHNLQLRILNRGLQLLKKGGRIVYSTCSMNPVENEAVIAAAIEACGGVSKVQLVDCSDHLPKLKRKPGLNTWKVFDTSTLPGGEDKKAHMFSSWDRFVNAKEKYDAKEPVRQFSSKITQGCFPPTAASEERRIPLERCVRVYPHLQDTGGFFIAVLEKLDDIKVTQIQNATNAAELRKMKAQSQSATPAFAQPLNVTWTEEQPTGAAPSEATPSLKHKLEDPAEIGTAKRVKVGETEEQSNGDAEFEAISSMKRKLENPEESATVKRAKTGDTAPESAVSGPEGQDAQAALDVDVDMTDAKPAPNGSTAAPARAREGTKLRPENQSQNKEYFEYLPSDDPTIADILEFFGVSPRFPRDRFMVKNKEGLVLNKIYYTSALAKTIISQNKDRGMKFIHCGVVMFVSHKIKDKDNVKAPWRLQNEGIRILEPWASKRIVNCTSKKTLRKLLIEMFPKLPKDGGHELAEVGDQLIKMEIGCCFLRIEKSEGDDGFPFRMVLPLWRHPGSANLMVDQNDRKAMLLRLFNENEPDIKNHVVEKQKAEEEEAKRLADDVVRKEVESELAEAEEEGTEYGQIGKGDEMEVDE